MTPEKPNNQLEEKRAAWGGFGVAIHETEIRLQAMAQKAILAIKRPEKVDDLLEARETIKSLRKEQALIEEERKKITKEFDKVFERLVIPERSFKPHISQIEADVIRITKEHAEEERKKKNLEDERKSVKQFAVEKLLGKCEEYNVKIANQVLFAFEWAITNKVKPDKISEYVRKCSEKLKVTDFAADYPVYTPKFITQIEADTIIKENFDLDANQFLSKLAIEMQAKFTNYEVDLKNAESALEEARKEHEKETTEIKNETNAEKVSAQLSAMATTVSVSIPVKELKKLHKVSDNNSDEELLKSLIENIVVLSKHIKNKQFYDVLKRAIETAKNKNEAEFNSIAFDLVDKL